MGDCDQDYYYGGGSSYYYQTFYDEDQTQVGKFTCLYFTETLPVKIF